MQWLNELIEAIVQRQPEGEILVSSGASPSGTYHLGHLRELITCDAVTLELRRRGRDARHIHVVDDLDAFRKVPLNIPADYDQHLGKPLCDVPAPDGSDRSYANYFLDPFIASVRAIGVDVEVIYSHEKYRAGFYVPAIEKSLEHIDEARRSLETVSGRKLDDNWTPIQIMENGRLKNRRFISIDKDAKTIDYENSEGITNTAHYDTGEVKLDWRLDWPGRWWLMNVGVEPFGRDHATKGGSYDTGVEIAKDIYNTAPPVPVPYDFINRTGDTKKMSASKGTGIHAHEVVQALPPEVIRYFILRNAPGKRLFFDEHESLIRLVDDFSALSSKTEPDGFDEQLLYLCTKVVQEKTISKIPFSHLVSSYQASLKDTEKTLDVIRRTEYASVVDEQSDIIRNELVFIDRWLDMWAPEDIKFSPLESVDATNFSDTEKSFLSALADSIKTAPEDADGAWFHGQVYEFKDKFDLAPKAMFNAIYRALIGKESGPRVGWFLSILPRDWLYERLKLQK